MINMSYLNKLMEWFKYKNNTKEDGVTKLTNLLINSGININSYNLLTGYFSGMLSGVEYNNSPVWGYYSLEDKAWEIYLVEHNFNSFTYKTINNQFDILNDDHITDIAIINCINESSTELYRHLDKLHNIVNKETIKELYASIKVITKELPKDYIDPSLINKIKSVDSNYYISMEGLTHQVKFDSSVFKLAIVDYHEDSDKVSIKLDDGELVMVHRRLLNAFIYSSNIYDSVTNKKAFVDLSDKVLFKHIDNIKCGVNSAVQYWSSVGIADIRHDYSCMIDLDKYPEIIDNIGKWIHIDANKFAKDIDRVITSNLNSKETSTLIVDLDLVDIKYRGFLLPGDSPLKERLNKCKIKLSDGHINRYCIGEKSVRLSGYYKLDGKLYYV